MRGDEFFAEISKRVPFTKLHPSVAAFFKDYFRQEKVVRFGDRFVVNTNFPPYPSGAFDRLTELFGELGDAATRLLYSVTVAVTNRCPFNCWHCYNAGRSQADMPLADVQTLARRRRDLDRRRTAAQGRPRPDRGVIRFEVLLDFGDHRRRPYPEARPHVA